MGEIGVPADALWGASTQRAVQNFQISGRRSFQYRLEAYNVLNNVQFQDVDRTARFDAAGLQTNANFGTSIGIANPTRAPRVVQMSVRFNF